MCTGSLSSPLPIRHRPLIPQSSRDSSQEQQWEKIRCHFISSTSASQKSLQREDKPPDIWSESQGIQNSHFLYAFKMKPPNVYLQFAMFQAILELKYVLQYNHLNVKPNTVVDTSFDGVLLSEIKC